MIVINRLIGELSSQRSPIHHDADIEAFNKWELVDAPTNGKAGRWARVTFKIVLSYHGASFDGWQKQPGLNTVQGFVLTFISLSIYL